MPVKKTSKKVVKKQTKQENQKMVDFSTAVSRFWTKYAEFDGTAQRSEYWWVVLFLFLTEVIFSIFTSAIPFMGILYWIWSIAIFIPCLSLGARRLHDAGFTAKWLLALWIGIILGFVFIIMGNISMLFIFLSEIAWLFAVGVGIFLLIVALLPSKMKNNPYRR